MYPRARCKKYKWQVLVSKHTDTSKMSDSLPKEDKVQIGIIL